VLGSEDGTWGEFITHVNSAFPRRRVLLILDNVNTPGLWPAVGSAAHQYLASRRGDKLILGSISHVHANNLTMRRVPVGGLDFASTEQMVASNDIAIDRAELAELHDHCAGLPFFVKMLAPFGSAMADGEIEGMEAAIEAQLIPRLDSATRSLLAHASLLAVVSRQIAIADLEKCPLPKLRARLETTKGMLTPIPGDRRLLRMHDVLRNIALRALVPEVTEAASLLFRQAREAGRTTDAALFAMFADPDEIGEASFDEVLEPVIKRAVKSRNYAVLDSLYLCANKSLPVMQLLSADQNRQDLFCYGRSSQLAGIGEYVAAEEKLMQGRLERVPDLHQASRSPLEPEMHFLLADIAHLQNRYDDAAMMFEELGDWAESTRQEDLLARCVWGRGHVLRHQGRDLGEALKLFESAIELAAPAKSLFAKAYSITGATGIKVFTRTVPEDEESRLAAIEDEIEATHTHESYMLEVWKSRAQVAWYRDEAELALSLTADAITRALALNDRLLYNLYFERAEFNRLTREHKAALSDYRQVLTFGEGNGDRNLISNARLGLVLTDLSAGRWQHFGSSDYARAAALEARQIALEADIQATGSIAEQIATMVESGPTEKTKSLRLILF
jgi:tetratricopeptide (TPR) repeat protein